MATRQRPALRQVMQRDRALTRLQRPGIAASARIAFLLLPRAARIARAGDDPTILITRTIDGDIQPIFVDAMTSAYMLGMVLVYEGAADQIDRRRVRLGPYDDAIAAMRERVGMTDEQVAAVRDQFGQQAAELAGQTQTAVNRRVQRAVQAGIEAGDIRSTGTRRIREAFAAAGVLPTDAQGRPQPHLFETLYRTQTQIAYSAGQWDALQDPAIAEIVWGYEYVAVGDDRTRPNHQAMNGVRLPRDDSWWASNWTPNGYNCRCQILEIYHGDRNARRKNPQPKKIDGEVVAPTADEGFAFNPGALIGNGATSPLPGVADMLRRPPLTTRALPEGFLRVRVAGRDRPLTIDTATREILRRDGNRLRRTGRFIDPDADFTPVPVRKKEITVLPPDESILPPTRPRRSTKRRRPDPSPPPPPPPPPKPTRRRRRRRPDDLDPAPVVVPDPRPPARKVKPAPTPQREMTPVPRPTTTQDFRSMPVADAVEAYGKTEGDALGRAVVEQSGRISKMREQGWRVDSRMAKRVKKVFEERVALRDQVKTHFATFAAKVPDDMRNALRVAGQITDPEERIGELSMLFEQARQRGAISAKDMRDHLALLKRQQQLNVAYRDATSRRARVQAFRESMDERERDMLTSVLRVDNPTTIELRQGADVKSRNIKQRSQSAADWLESITSRDFKTALNVSTGQTKRDRAYVTVGSRKIMMSPSSATYVHAHEMGHVIENSSRHAAERARDYLKARSTQPGTFNLRSKHGRAYGSDERAFFADFKDDYTARAYIDNRGDVVATEVISKGLDQLHSDAARLYQSDPGLFNFVVGVIRGKI